MLRCYGIPKRRPFSRPVARVCNAPTWSRRAPPHCSKAARPPGVQALRSQRVRSSWGRGGGSPLHGPHHSPLPGLTPSCQPPLAQAKASSPPEATGWVLSKCWEEDGGWGWGKGWSLRPASSCSLRPFAPSLRCERDAASMGTAGPRPLPPNREPLGCGRVPAPDAGAEQPSALLVPRSRKRGAGPCAGCRSHHTRLTPTVSVPAVLGHCGPGTGGGEALSGLSLLCRRQAAGGGKLCALAGLGAVPSDSEDVAVALVGRRGGRRKRMNQAQHHKPSSHKNQRHTLPPLAHPQSLKSVTDDVLQHFRWKTHTNKQHPLTHSQRT